MEVLASPSEQKLIFTGQWLCYNTLLVVVHPPQIVEQSSCQLPHHGRDGVHSAHSDSSLVYL